MERNDEKFKENTKNKLKQNSDKIHEFTSKIETVFAYNEKIPNIGITINGKIMDMFRLYTEKNKELCTSKLYDLIYDHLMKYSEKAERLLSDLIKYIMENQKKIQKSKYKNIENIYSTIIGYVNEYKKLDDEVYDFTIKKNITDALESLIVWTKEIENTGGLTEYSINPNGCIEEYNKELEELGFDVRLPLNNKKSL